MADISNTTSSESQPEETEVISDLHGANDSIQETIYLSDHKDVPATDLRLEQPDECRNNWKLPVVFGRRMLTFIQPHITPELLVCISIAILSMRTLYDVFFNSY